MLVLARKVGETIVINGDIRVTVLGVDGDRVRVGIDAPRSVPILRSELFDAVHQENLAAVKIAHDPQLRQALTTALKGEPE